MASTLDPEILGLVEMSPIEDLLLALLPQHLPGVKVQSLISLDQTFPFVLVRRANDWGLWGGDQRFVDEAQITIHTFCDGTRADEDAALLAEAVRVILRDSLEIVVDGHGWLKKVKLMEAPIRKQDWGTNIGPVQYAELPSGVYRYETNYQVRIRRSLTKPFPASP